MPLCSRCQALAIDDIVDCDVLFHPDLGSLKASAEHGCAFCALCWYECEKETLAAQLDTLLRGGRLAGAEQNSSWTPTIWLRGDHFFHRGRDGACINVSCGKGYGTYIDGEPEPYFNSVPGAVLARLEVYESYDSQSKYRLRGRRTTIDWEPENDIPSIKRWLGSCCTSHPRCNVDASSKMPTRVLDVVGDEPKGGAVRLILSDGRSEPYIALSYCWGVTGDDILTLTRSTYQAMMAGINEANLAKSHRDVISIARAVGIRYVWVDALCIVQGDAVDWERESKAMADVYGNAMMTVIAGRAADARDGFLTNDLTSSSSLSSSSSPRYGRRPPPCKLRVDATAESLDADTLVIDVRRNKNVGPVSTRGWCFQERLGCKRAVIFGEEQLAFECITEVAHENGHAKENTRRPSFLQPVANSETDAVAQMKTRDASLREWYYLLGAYTECHLSNPHDIFAAAAALAHRAERVMLGSRYLAGLWECDIVRGLLWRPCYHVQVGARAKVPVTRPQPTRLVVQQGGSPAAVVVRAPSWSWAAVQGPVAQENFTPTRIARYKNDASFVKVRSACVGDPGRWSESTDCGVGAMRMPSCPLRLRGQLARAVVSRTRLAIDYIKSAPGWQKKGVPKAPNWAVERLGFLLEEAGGGADDGQKGKDMAGDHAVAIGFFDVFEESQGVNDVWCLLVVVDRGLILKKNEDGAFERIGWFVPEDMEWFEDRESTELRLL